MGTGVETCGAASVTMRALKATSLSGKASDESARTVVVRVTVPVSVGVKLVTQLIVPPTGKRATGGGGVQTVVAPDGAPLTVQLVLMPGPGPALVQLVMMLTGVPTVTSCVVAPVASKSAMETGVNTLHWLQSSALLLTSLAIEEAMAVTAEVAVGAGLCTVTVKDTDCGAPLAGTLTDWVQLLSAAAQAGVLLQPSLVPPV